MNFDCEILETTKFHLFSIFRIVVDTSNFFSVIVFVEVISRMFECSISIFQLDMVIINCLWSSKFFFYHVFFLFQSIGKPGFDIGMTIYIVIATAVLLFLLCYFGNKTTSNLLSFASHLYESNWHELPNDVQKYFIVMINSAQQPLYYSGCYLFNLELSTFSKVIL